ncbi:MAG: L-2-amino-thiazoline-4-carboxylic acid hydrolase [Alphaproteobacteria bacterium]|jgi:hypothetical protein|nr:L-2-amino-thiazoline-4-carboxylic acid hydrolase [Alphaproteobacteria bacterium]|tara:strand:- start:44 stop:556 length:513 start_codon:yes stop_codon:yes gene_type:complete
MTQETMVLISTLRAALKMRAAAYAHMFDVMREQLGLEKALEIGKEATRRLGSEMAGNYRQYGPDDLQGLKEAFLGAIPGGGELFIPEVVKCDQDELEIYFQKCPLKDAWTDLDRSDEDLEHLCDFAGAIDAGMFTSAGFTFAGETWKPGQSGCCRLRVRPGVAENKSGEN